MENAIKFQGKIINTYWIPTMGLLKLTNNMAMSKYCNHTSLHMCAHTISLICFNTNYYHTVWLWEKHLDIESGAPVIVSGDSNQSLLIIMLI